MSKCTSVTTSHNSMKTVKIDDQDKFFSQLQKTFKLKQAGEFIPKKELETFNNWVITAYSTAPIAVVTMEELSFSAAALPHQLELYRLTNEKTTKHVTTAVAPQTLNKIPTKEMAAPLRSMASPFAILPVTLNDFQMRHIASFESLFSYAAAYIVREAWGRKLCQLPKIDNKLKPLMHAWSERWFRIFKLCVNCRDFLSDHERENFPKSWDWLDAIAQEQRTSHLLRSTSEQAAEESGGKSTLVAYERRFADLLQNFSNPVVLSARPSLHRLVEISLNVSEKADVFRDDYLRPYVRSVRNWASVLEASPHITAVLNSGGKTKHERRGKKG